MLADAPESIMQIELVRLFIEDFYDKQKFNLVVYGFIPFTIYAVSAYLYIMVARENMKQLEQGEDEFKVADIVAFVVFVAGTIYFTVLEVVQYRTLRSKYFRIFNVLDVVYLLINYCFIADFFSGYMDESTELMS